MIRVIRGDLAQVTADCLLRAARSDGAPVDAVSRRLDSMAGSSVTERVAAQGEVPPGTAYLTPAGELSASFLVHVVVQSPDDPVTQATVRRGLVNGLRRAADLGLESVALPPLGAGAGNMAVEETARLMVEVLTEHLAAGAAPRLFHLVVQSEYEEEVFRSLVAESGDVPEA